MFDIPSRLEASTSSYLLGRFTGFCHPNGRRKCQRLGAAPFFGPKRSFSLLDSSFVVFVAVLGLFV